MFSILGDVYVIYCILTLILRVIFVAIMAGKGQQQTADSENDSFGLFIAFADVVY